MNLRCLATIATACVAALAVVGCSGSGDEGLPPVPPIEDPKQARSSNPCELVHDERLERLGVGAGDAGRNDLGQQCVWRGSGSRKLTLTVFAGPDGLATLAQNSDSAASRVRIEGYPAVETFTEHGVYCQYDIGIAPNQALIATMTGGQPDSCTVLQDVLTGVLQNLPPYRG